jgi:peptide/nickel transport system substrate-binding protein
MDLVNPYQHSTGHLYGVWSSIMEPLVRYDFDKSDYVGILAESWKIESDTTWLFNLRKNIKFTDGSPFTAADVKHSVERMKTDPNSQQADNFKPISDVQVVDDNTVRFTTTSPVVTLLSILDYRSMTSKAAYDKFGPDKVDQMAPFGTGPYKFKELISGQRWVLEKNTTYWGELAADTPDTLIYRPVPESQVRVTMLLNGEAQIAKFLAPEQIPQVQNGPNSHVASTPGLRIMFVTLAPKYPPFDNPLVRQAANYAVDKEGLVQGILNGQAIVLDGPIGAEQYSYNPAALTTRYTYDPDKAKQLLAQAGFANGVDAQLLTPVGTYTKDKELMEALAAQLTAVGIRTQVGTQDTTALFDAEQKGQLAMEYTGRGSVQDPSDYLRQWFRTGVTNRLPGYSNPKLDAILDQQLATFDTDARKQMLADAYNLIMSDAPVIFLWSYQDAYGVANTIDWKPQPNEHIRGFEMHVKG